MKILQFTFRGGTYLVNEMGEINANNIGYFSKTWIFLGGSKHHWATHIQVPLNKVFENPESINGCIGWDKDHGTTRRWGGQYNGKIPRISNAKLLNS